MRETVVIKYFLVLIMLFMSYISFYEVYFIKDFIFRVIMFLSGIFFLYYTVWILRIKAK